MLSVALDVQKECTTRFLSSEGDFAMGDPQQQKPCKDSDTPKDDPSQKPPETGGNDKQEPPKDDGCGEPKPPRECGEPEPPENPCGDPCADPVPPPPPDNCSKRPFDKEIQALEDQSNQEERDSKKSLLAAYKKLSDDVAKAEKDYAKDYDSLARQEEASETFTDNLKTLLDGKLTPAEKKRIAEIVYCEPKVEELKQAWLTARDELPGLQKTLSEKQNAQADQEAEFKEALTKYQTAQKALDEIQTQSSKAVDAKTYRVAWFLNQFEECPGLKPPPIPCKFNDWLEGIAQTYVEASDAARQAKVAVDQKTADAQKKKKEYEDEKAKRRDNILKTIAADPFAASPAKDKTSEESSSESNAA